MRPDPSETPRRWSLKDDATPFTQVVRRARGGGAQHVSVEGLGDVVVLAAEEFLRLSAGQSGQALVEAFAASPHREIDIDVDRAPMPVREPAL